MVIADVPDVDALVARFLLPSAPLALVDEVRRYLAENGNAHVAVRAGVPSRYGTNGRTDGSLSRRNPWQVLHVARCAPRAIVDIAYEFRSRSQIAPPLSHQMMIAPMRSATADDRLAGLAAPSMTPRVSSNGAGSPGAFIETASGEHRYGIADLPLRIGTDTGCDVLLSQSGPLEVRIWPHGDRYMLRVVSGPVRVAGEPATWVVLDDGDILEIGDATFRFRFKETP